MFGWLRVSAMGRVIHEMACMTLHQQNEFGAPLHRIFTHHPLLINLRAQDDGLHTFYLSDGKQSFTVMVQGNKPSWLSIAPDGDFYGVHVQSSSKGRYMVRLDSGLLHPKGRLADKLSRHFVVKYDAMDMGV